MKQTSSRGPRPPAARRSRLFWIAVALVPTAAIVPLIAQMANKNTPPASSVAQAKSAALPAAGMRAFKDPATGQFRDPDPTEIQTLGDAPAVPSTPPRDAPQFPLPGGGFGARLDESTMAFAVAKLGPDGKVTFECVTGEQQATKALARPPAPAGTQPASNQVLEVE